MSIQAQDQDVEPAISIPLAHAKEMWTQEVLAELEQEESLIAEWYAMSRRIIRLRVAAAQARLQKAQAMATHA